MFLTGRYGNEDAISDDWSVPVGLAQKCFTARPSTAWHSPPGW